MFPLYLNMYQIAATRSLFGSSTTSEQNKLGSSMSRQQEPTGFASSRQQIGPFGQQQQTGTVIKFTPITGTDVIQKGRIATWINTKHHCITFMKEYEGKSFEELRYEDYLANRKGSHQDTGFKATPFRAAASSAPLLFREAVEQALGQITAFGQSVTGFGDQIQQNTTGLSTLPASTCSFRRNRNVASSFGATQQSKRQQSRVQCQSSSSFQSTSSHGTFGQSSIIGSPGTAQTGTVIKFTPVTGTNVVQKCGVTTWINTKHHCITCMREYEGKSLEELRYEDYLANRKASHQHTGFKASSFGTTASSAPLSFRQTYKPAFGQTRTTFGESITGFGDESQQNTGLFGKPTTGFRTLTASTPSFGTNKNVANSIQQSKRQQSRAQCQSSSSFHSTSAHGTFGQSSTIDSPGTAQTGTVIKFTPIIGTDVVQKCGITTWISTKHHCITYMKEYEGKSLEELRYEDYLKNRKGSQQQMGSKSTLFGTTASCAPSFFRQADNKPASGQTTSSGQAQSTFGQSVTGFVQQNQQNTVLFGKPTTGFGTLTASTSSFGTNTNVAKQRQYPCGPSAEGSNHQNNDRNCFSTPPSPSTSLSGKSPLGQSVVGADFQGKKNSNASFSSKPFSANFALDNQPGNGNSCSLVSPFGQTFSSFELCGISSSLQNQQNVVSDSPTPFSEQKQSSTGSSCHNQRNNCDNSRRGPPSSYLFDKCGEKVDFVQAQSPSGESGSNSNLHAQLNKDDSQQNVDSDSPTAPFPEEEQSSFGKSGTGSDCHNRENNGGNSSRTLPSSYLFDDKSCTPPPSLVVSLFEKSSDKTIFEQTQPSGQISADPDLQNEQKIYDSPGTPVPSTSHSLSNPEDNSVVGQTNEKTKSSSEQSSLPVPSVPLLFNSSEGELVFGHSKESGDIKPSSGKSRMSFVVQNECNSGNDSCTTPSPLFGCTNDESLPQQIPFSSELPDDSKLKKQETTDTSSSEYSLCDQKGDKIVSAETIGSERMLSLLERFCASLNLQNL